MLVCHCHRISDRTIRALVREGGASCADSVGDACGAGTHCGGCRPMVERIVQDESRERSQPRFCLPLVQVAS